MKYLTWMEIEAASKLSYGDGVKAPPIRALAEFINLEMPAFRATVSEWSERPCRKYKGSRLAHYGKTRYGLKLYVYNRSEEAKLRAEGRIGSPRPVLEHTTTDPYRRNWEVCRWIMENRGTSCQS